MNKLECVVTDLDATLLNDNKEINPADVETIHRLKAMGIPVFAVTGRAAPFARQVVEAMGFDLPICACNGGHVYDYLTKKTLYSKPIDRCTFRKVYDYLNENEIDYIIYTHGKNYFSGEETRRCQRWKFLNTKLKPENRIEFSFVTDPDFDPDTCDAIKFLLGYVTKEQSEAFEAHFGPDKTLTMAYSGAGLFDVNAYGVDKSLGVKFLAQHYGFSLENTLAMGDHHNDIAMLTACGYSASPQNGQEEIKEMVRFVTSDNNTSPLTTAVQHFFPGLL